MKEYKDGLVVAVVGLNRFDNNSKNKLGKYLKTAVVNSLMSVFDIELRQSREFIREVSKQCSSPSMALVTMTYFQLAKYFQTRQSSEVRHKQCGTMILKYPTVIKVDELETECNIGKYSDLPKFDFRPSKVKVKVDSYTSRSYYPAESDGVVTYKPEKSEVVVSENHYCAVSTDEMLTRTPYKPNRPQYRDEVCYSTVGQEAFQDVVKNHHVIPPPPTGVYVSGVDRAIRKLPKAAKDVGKVNVSSLDVGSVEAALKKSSNDTKRKL